MAASCPASSGRSPSRATVGRGHPGGPGRRDRGAVLPGDLSAVRDVHRRGRDHRGQGQHRPPRRRAETDRDGRDGPGPVGHDGGPFVVSLPMARCVPPVVEQLKEVLMTHPGPTEVHLRLRGNQRTTVVRLDDKLRVANSPALLGDLKQLLGPTCVELAVRARRPGSPGRVPGRGARSPCRAGGARGLHGAVVGPVDRVRDAGVEFGGLAGQEHQMPVGRRGRSRSRPFGA